MNDKNNNISYDLITIFHAIIGFLASILLFIFGFIFENKILFFTIAAISFVTSLITLIFELINNKE